MGKYIASSTNQKLAGGADSDDFYFNGAISSADFVVSGGTTTTATLINNVSYYTDNLIAGYVNNSGVPNSGNVNNVLTVPKALDTIWFNKSGDYTNIEFSNIEAIRLKDGVSITLTAEQFGTNVDSLFYGPLDSNGTPSYNPGMHFYGTGGGKSEVVNFVVDYDSSHSFTGNGVTTSYAFGDLQFDDADIGNVFHDVQMKVNASKGSTTSSYFRGDGSNNDDYFNGSKGVDNFDGRLGNDTYYGNSGNDKLTGQGGADYLNGGAGDDYFLITSMAGTDGEAEWVDGDVIIGGAGNDTLRVTGAAGYAARSVITLTDDNFQSMERVEVGGTITRLTSEDSALQLINNHYYHNASASLTGADYIIVDASGVTKKGLTFVGNANANTFLGTSQSDTFIGNGGNDTFTGGSGNDRFEFGKVKTYAANNTVKAYDTSLSSLIGKDTVTDFTVGKDKIVLHVDQFASLSSSSSASNLLIGAAAQDSNDFLIFDPTTNTLKYDADGSGVGIAADIVVLAGVANLTFSDFLIV